ncbi:hypothetical protein BYT27DRAFT_7203264 [Phlegmacium glaucopus]|nr:hypothetical protein BYT27DRAFT_7203264 [Phlegmacium glaucopus]
MNKRPYVYANLVLNSYSLIRACLSFTFSTYLAYIEVVVPLKSLSSPLGDGVLTIHPKRRLTLHRCTKGTKNMVR